MSAQDNLSSSQFVDVARGIQSDRPQQPLGKHWSSDEGVAMIFGEAGLRSDTSTVFFGRVHPNSVVQPGTEEHERMAEDYAIHSPESLEKEVTVRPGSKVYVTGLMRRSAKRDRMITYNTPREMTA